MELMGAPVPPPRPSAGRMVFGVFFLILAVGLAALFFAAWFMPQFTLPVRTMLYAASLPKELTDTRLIEDLPSGTTTYVKEGFNFRTEPGEATLISASKSGRHVAEIRLSSDGKYVILVDGKSVATYATSTVGIALSPDGSHVAFAQAVDAATKVPPTGFLTNASLNPREWTIRVLYPLTGATTDLGPGAAPVYLDDQHLLRVTARGLYVFDFTTAHDTLALEHVFPSISFSTLVSPDRTHIGVRDMQARTITFYQVSPDGVMEDRVLRTPSRVMSFALGNEGLYLLRTSRYGTVIYKQGAGASAAQVGMLPEDLQISRLFLTAL